MPGQRGIRRLASAVRSTTTSVFGSVKADFEAMHSACADFQTQNPGSRAWAHNDGTDHSSREVAKKNTKRKFLLRIPEINQG